MWYVISPMATQRSIPVSPSCRCGWICETCGWRHLHGDSETLRSEARWCLLPSRRSLLRTIGSNRFLAGIRQTSNITYHLRLQAKGIAPATGIELRGTGQGCHRSYLTIPTVVRITFPRQRACQSGPTAPISRPIWSRARQAVLRTADSSATLTRSVALYLCMDEQVRCRNSRTTKVILLLSWPFRERGNRPAPADAKERTVIEPLFRKWSFPRKLFIGRRQNGCWKPSKPE